MESIIILIKLLCAHLCSDFILQTDSINNGKRKPGIKGIGYHKWLIDFLTFTTV